MPTPYDIARCHGVRHQGVLSDQCKTCKRTDPPRHVWQTYIEGMLDYGFCENRIPREDFTSMGDEARREMLRGCGA